MHTSDGPKPITACWLSWIAVSSADQAAVVARLGLAGMRDIGWSEGVDLVDDVAHSGDDRFSTVVVTPAVEGWTLVIGAWCGLPWPAKVEPVTELCRDLSTRFGSAQVYFHSQQNDGDAWLIAEGGEVRRRWIAELPELSLGEPSGVERRLLDAYGIAGKPEDLDPDDDKFGEWLANWGDCYATTIAAELSVDPTAIDASTPVSGTMLVATPPPSAPSTG